jgi:hypothetical protein
MELPAALKDMLSSGKRLLTDTRVRRTVTEQKKKGPATKNLAAPPETDPLKIFTRRGIDERPPKDEMVKDIKKFIKAAEDAI